MSRLTLVTLFLSATMIAQSKPAPFLNAPWCLKAQFLESQLSL
jgi:hypothetical protein